MYHHDKFKVVNDNFNLFTKNTLSSKDVDIEIWTDGACRNNGRENARAAWAFVSGKHEETGLVSGKQTNNTAEASAIYHGLKWAAGKGAKSIRIYSDSQISLNNLQKELSQIKNNQEIFAAIFQLIKKYNLSVTYEKVLGHAGNLNNERADRLANSLAGMK